MACQRAAELSSALLCPFRGIVLVGLVGEVSDFTGQFEAGHSVLDGRNGGRDDDC